MTTQHDAAGALSVRDFCNTFGVSRTTFYEELKTGRLSARKIGRKTLVLVADAERWAQSLPRIAARNARALGELRGSAK